MPVLLTSQNRGVAVVQSLRGFEIKAEQASFLKAVVMGMMDVEQGHTHSLEEAKERFGL